MAALAVSAAPTISVDFHGSLRDALREVAHKGGLSLVATGELDVPAEVVLSDISAEEALTTVAKAYELTVVHEGKLWVVKPAGAVAAVAAVPPIAPVVAPVVTPEPDADNDVEKIRARAEAM